MVFQLEEKILQSVLFHVCQKEKDADALSEETDNCASDGEEPPKPQDPTAASLENAKQELEKGQNDAHQCSSKRIRDSADGVGADLLEALVKKRKVGGFVLEGKVARLKMPRDSKDVQEDCCNSAHDGGSTL